MYMSSVLREDDGAAHPWCAGPSHTAQHCAEAQLFHGWEHDDAKLTEPEEKLHGLLQDTDGKLSDMSDSPSAVASEDKAVDDMPGKELNLAKKIDMIGRDLCSDPKHRTSSECAHFLTSASDAANKAWHESFAAKIASVGHELCSNPSSHNYLACKQFDHFIKSSSSENEELVTKGEMVATDISESEEISETHQKELQWNKVEQWKTSSSTRLRGSTSRDISSLTTEDVSKIRVFSHWKGRIPRVACVTLVPKTREAKAWLPYFVNNFRLQNYEGEHQLILVYHHSDIEAAHILDKYANSTDVQVAAAHGEDFPSAAAFRFGAYLAQRIDVIARWDFAAWHHPQRLSAQVRALAFSGRPACLLKQWTLLDNTGANITTVEGVFWDSSLVGEASWMQSNWYPLVGEVEHVSGAGAAHLAAIDDHVAFTNKVAQELVTIETPGLEVFDEAWRW
jgi:hypothetical protein